MNESESFMEIKKKNKKPKYKVKFWTESGGCSRSDNLTCTNSKWIRKMILDDIGYNPYLYFWYGQYIDIQNTRNKKKIQLYSKDQKHIKMNLILDGKNYSSIDEFDQFSETHEMITNGLFIGGEIIEFDEKKQINDQTFAYIKMAFKKKFKGDFEMNKHLEHELFLEITINFTFLEKIR